MWSEEIVADGHDTDAQGYIRPAARRIRGYRQRLFLIDLLLLRYTSLPPPSSNIVIPNFAYL